jgi:hypothetical protein
VPWPPRQVEERGREGRLQEECCRDARTGPTRRTPHAAGFLCGAEHVQSPLDRRHNQLLLQPGTGQLVSVSTWARRAPACGTQARVPRGCRRSQRCRGTRGGTRPSNPARRRPGGRTGTRAGGALAGSHRQRVEVIHVATSSSMEKIWGDSGRRSGGEGRRREGRGTKLRERQR